jgi:16S rRNA (cytidine1402-2'-O)-methyltransferase
VNGKIYLIPVTLGGENYNDTIPSGTLEIAGKLRYFVVEELRSARRFLRMIDKGFPIDDSDFKVLNEHTGDSDISSYLDPCLRGNDIGLMSEAGMPGVADPGARLVKIAHRKGLRVVPLSGPSSIFMTLAASGMNGQNFTFNGYLPVKNAEREVTLRQLEKKAHEGIAQIFIETPYRCQKMFESIVAVCNGNTLLCIGADISLPAESVITRKVSEWKIDIPDLRDRFVVFILQ